MADSIDINFLKQAIEISKQVKPSSTHFSVGAVLVDKNRQFVTSGFTEELGAGWHAEAVAIKKANDVGFDAKGATVYSTMEPCSVRASSSGDCSTLLIEKGIARIIFALSEPPIFVTREGINKLKTAGIEVEQISDLESAVIAINKHLIPASHAQSRLLAYAAYALLVYACTCNCILAADPQTDFKKTDSNTNQLDSQNLVGKYYIQALKQFGLNQNNLRRNKLIDNQGQLNGEQVSKAIESLPIKSDQINKSMGFLKGLIYDPSNPSPFFNNLIALQTMSASAQNQLLTFAESSLGPKNSYVIGLKDNYNHTLKYLEALKQQKVLLEQTTMHSSHK